MSAAGPGPHVAMLLGLALARVRAGVVPEEWDGLRVSHFRVLEAVADGAGRTVDLAQVLGMTKQGAGQHVAFLVDGGFLAVGHDPGDRRVRRISVTARGEDLIGRLRVYLSAVERTWAAEVGPHDYEVFRRVLARIAHGEDLYSA